MPPPPRNKALLRDYKPLDTLVVSKVAMTLIFNFDPTDPPKNGLDLLQSFFSGVQLGFMNLSSLPTEVIAAPPHNKGKDGIYLVDKHSKINMYTYIYI